MAFTPDGKQVTAALPRMNTFGDRVSAISTWNVESGKPIAEIADKSNRFAQIQWAPDGKSFLLHRGVVEVRAADGTTKQLIGEEPRSPYDAAFDSSGRLLTASPRPGSFVVRDETTNKQLAEITMQPGDRWVGFSSDGKLAFASQAGRIVAYDLATGAVAHRVTVAAPPISALGWNGKVLAWGSGPHDFSKQQPLEQSFDFAKLQGSPIDNSKPFTRNRLEWDGVQLASDSYSATVKKNGKAVKLSYEPELDSDNILTSTLAGPDHAVLSIGSGMSGYDTATGKLVCNYSHPTMVLAPTPDGKFFATTYWLDPFIRVFRSGQSEAVLYLYVVDNEWVAWTPAGAWASSPGATKFVGRLTRPEPGKLATFVPFDPKLRDPDAVNAALK